MTNLIVFPPSFLLIQLFRRSRRRVTRSAQLKETVNKIKEKNKRHAQAFGSVALHFLPKLDKMVQLVISLLICFRSYSNFNSESKMDLFRAPSAQSSYQQPTDSLNGQYAPDNYQPVKEPQKKKKQPLTLPWWCKILAYVLSFLFAAVSLFFIIMQGISLGNEQVTKWVTSLAVSFLASVLLTQPLEVSFWPQFLEKRED